MIKKTWPLALLALVLLVVSQPDVQAQGEDGGNFQNLQFFPKDIPRDDLKGIMKGFTKQLDVKCSYCHVPDEYHKDDKEHKQVARAMLRMMKNLNDNAEEFFPGGRNEKLRCWTCHRGSTEIEEWVPEEEE